MSSKFLTQYIANLQTLKKEISDNKRKIQLLNNSINKLTSDVRRELHDFLHDAIRSEKKTLEERNSKIKKIYLLSKTIEQNYIDKRSLTRKSCKILDTYLNSLDKQLKNLAANNVMSYEREMLNSLFSNKLQVNQTVSGKARIIALLKNSENGGWEQSDILGSNNQLDNLSKFSNVILDTYDNIKERCYDQTRVNTSRSSDDDYIEDDANDYRQYCHCQNMAFGLMISCENAKCKVKWYHFKCVAVHRKLIETWYCPRCIIFENVS